MIKFSKITNQKVNSEPIVEVSKEALEVEGFKQSIIDLIEKTLTVRNEGSYKHAMITSKIDGKELFIEALMNFLSEKENKKAITYLESLKESNSDWKSIDDKISQIESENDNIKFLKENSSYVDKITAFLDKYYLSEDFDDILEKQILKITDLDGSLIRIKIASIMLESNNYSKYPKNRIRSLINKFTYRSKQLIG